MTKVEAQGLVQKCGVLFANAGFTQGNGTIKRTLYADKFEEFDFETMKKAIDKLILSNKFLPSLAEFYETYQVIRKKQGMGLPARTTKNACNVCGGLGFLIKPHTVNMLPYDYLYYCECKAGQRWAYDGRIIKEDQSEFLIPSIAEYHRNEQLESA
ncbi:MAG: hypothetical protein APF81_13380 [Desulfosporosinus sp. BRH_c37]|nr:MAG: hypothetical protein APF81_13380 [Desulfosporosinus sp. BRH_c37]